MLGLPRPPGRRSSTAVVLSGLLVLAIVALTLVRSSSVDTATATGGGAEMLLNVLEGGCDNASRPTTCTVGLGEPFTLSVEVVTAPAQGYVFMQSFIDYGSSIVYQPRNSASEEIVWADCASALAVSGIPSPSLIVHGCFTGFPPTWPASNAVGSIVQLSFRCSAAESSSDVRLRPYLDPVADTLGTLFKDANGPNGTEIVPKVSNLTVACSDPSAPPGASTVSPTPTVSVTPTPSATTSAGSPTETAVSTATLTPTATRQATATPTNEAKPPTETATVTATATPTPTPTSTLTPTPCSANSIRVGGNCVSFTPTPEALVGDTSCDGTVNPLDAALILQLAAGMIPALPCPGGGDTNGDGVTNPLDAALVLQFSAGLLDSLPS